MKKTLSFLAALMMMSSLILAADSPGEKPGTAVIKNGTTYKLYYNGLQQSDVLISIRNASDQLVFKEVLKQVDGFMRPYNFSHLSEGDYTIEIRDNNGLKVEKIKYEKDADSKFARILKLSGDERKYLLMISNKTADAVKVRILDESDNVIYSQYENIEGDFAKIYNLEKYSGNGRFEIIASDGTAKYIGY
jgi:hypothetical protein